MIGNKRDERKKIVKSTTPTSDLKKPIARKQMGGTLFSTYNSVDKYIPPTFAYEPIEIHSEILTSPLRKKQETVIEKVKEKETPIEVKKENKLENIVPAEIENSTPKVYKGLDSFNKAYDRVEKELPEAKDYRQFLTEVAKHESGYTSAIKNKNAPAYGYFQFMQDNNRYNNIRAFAGTDINTFLNNPELQIKAAIKLAKANEKGLSQKDLETAKSKGISKWGLIGGTWLGGLGGLRKYLHNNINVSDKGWDPNKKAGIDMSSQIKRYNFQSGGVLKYQKGNLLDTQSKVIKEYAPAVISSFIIGNPTPLINKISGVSSKNASINRVNDNLWKFENAGNSGLKDGLYYPYKTGNGNMDVGQGFDLKHQPKEFRLRATKGISKQELDKEAKSRLSSELPFIEAKLNKHSNNNADTISQNMKEGLLDMSWQLKNGIYGYDNLFDAIAKGDINKIQEESKVKYRSRNKRDFGEWKFDSGRHKRRIDNYFHY